MMVVREIGRLVLQAAVQALQPKRSASTRCPKTCAIFNVEATAADRIEADSQSIHRDKVWEHITLWRTGYRSWQRGEETIFPSGNNAWA